MACGPDTYYPYGYKMYRVYDAEADQQPDQITENCRLWQQLTSSEIPLSDIRQVVYKYTLDQMNYLRSADSNNAFASWIMEHNDQEIFDFLVLAKKCERTRSEMNDPWYYPSKKDANYLSLGEIEQKAKAYNGKRLKDRYVLQAIRAMFSAKRYQEIVDYWREVESSLPDGVIKNMTCGYVRGAYARLDRLDEALDYFTAEGDLNSIIFCLREKGEIKDFADELECINRYAPDSQQIPSILQNMIEDMEPWGNWDYSYEYRRDTSLVADQRYASDIANFNKLYNLANKMTVHPSSDKAVWHYTAAFLADLDARSVEAWQHIQKASQYQASDYLKASIRVMKMYLDAKVSTYDAAYESRLLADLKWLDGKIKNNIGPEVGEIISGWECYKIRNNISCYYWNDMLRRILLAEICPRMNERGMTSSALGLANMADNRLFMLSDLVDGKTMKEHRSGKENNYFDYRGDFFNMMDECEAEDLIAYIKRTESPKSSLDIFLKERGFIDMDYMYDILGTKYIRHTDYSNAIKYLSKVSSIYQKRLNTNAYMGRDPFSIEKKRFEVKPQYKLEFAKEMLRLEQAIDSASDPSLKGMDMIRYATGMHNSYTFCWSLSRYEDSWDRQKKYVEDQEFNSRIEKMYNEALSMIENDELAAIALVKLCQWKTAVQKYPDTYASRYVEVSCDNLCNYSMDWVLNRDL